MPITSYDIRICNSCGLRYPLVEGHPFGTRCPACMGETRIALRVSRQLVTEPSPTRPLNLNTKDTKDTKEEEKLPNLRGLRGSKSFSVLLDNIRSAWNVGSILRSADGFGFMHAYLCGITPTADNEAVTKTSLGAEDTVPWSYHKDAVKLIKGLKKEGWKVYALEEDERSISLESDSLASPWRHGDAPALQILIIGNEVTGVDPELLDLCDQIFYIPMRGEKKSFNVAIAFGIAAYALSVRKLES
ncbi:MAG TPA: RNA methyltransferase [Anaerolineales bacterium]